MERIPSELLASQHLEDRKLASMRKPVSDGRWVLRSQCHEKADPQWVLWQDVPGRERESVPSELLASQHLERAMRKVWLQGLDGSGASQSRDVM